VIFAVLKFASYTYVLNLLVFNFINLYNCPRTFYSCRPTSLYVLAYSVAAATSTTSTPPATVAAIDTPDHCRCPSSDENGMCIKYAHCCISFRLYFEPC